MDDQQKPVAAVIPLRVTIRDPEGYVAEFTGYYAGVGGQLELHLDIAPNDRFGSWSIEVEELASGRSAVTYFRVPPPASWPPASGDNPDKIINSEQPRG